VQRTISCAEYAVNKFIGWPSLTFDKKNVVLVNIGGQNVPGRNTSPEEIKYPQTSMILLRNVQRMRAKKQNIHMMGG
jgi:hypothetical protein